jgi:hypothetical protein
MVSGGCDEVVARAGALAAAQWHVTLSGLEREAMEQMEVLRRGNSERVHVVKRWRPHVTHVVATCNEQRLAKRTLKYVTPAACTPSLQPSGPPPPHSPSLHPSPGDPPAASVAGICAHARQDSGWCRSIG